jgi:hypothetical protein
VAYTQTVTISSGEHDTLEEFRASSAPSGPSCPTPGRIIQTDLDIAE